MKTLPLTLCAVALAAMTALAADISGTWNVEGDVVGNPVKFACDLKQDGEKLTGMAKVEGADVQLTGTAKDASVTFEFDTEHQGTTYHLVFTGTLGDDGGLKGKIAVAGVEGTFTAKRQ